ncbi:MAG: tetratricopeptide repeat protein [Myxococcota bacterium]
MSASPTAIERLRRRAETALEADGRHVEAETLLDQLVESAPKGSEHALFAHRHLAELRLERHPWRAALHLREVARARPHDDVPHALMGLCQALLGNYRSAVEAYRRALVIAPDTPWYHHNLGHLLDVALDRPKEAVEHLRIAHELEPTHDEIAASYAHGLARLVTETPGADLSEPLRVAREALVLAPDNRDHARLIAWIEQGAPPEGDVSSEPPEGATGRPGRDDAGSAVRKVFEREMRGAGFSLRQVERARALWDDFGRGRRLRMKKPEVYAAAIEYAMAVVLRRRGATQASIARRYGIATTSLSSRYGEIRDALELRPGDPRYAAFQ